MQPIKSNADNSKPMQALMLKPTEAARMAGVSVRTITRMCENREVKAVKLRGAWRLNRAAFVAMLGIAD